MLDFGLYRLIAVSGSALHRIYIVKKPSAWISSDITGDKVSKKGKQQRQGAFQYYRKRVQVASQLRNIILLHLYQLFTYFIM